MPYPSTVASIDAELTALGKLPGVTVKPCGHLTSGGQTVRYLHIAAGPPGGGSRVRVGVVAGIHAREWAPPDALLTFVRKLLTQYAAGRGIRYASYTHPGPPPISFEPFLISYPQVKRIVEKLDLFVLPCANPDGRAFSQTPPPVGDLNWRKNRNVVVAPNVGVDVNRNFDIAWDFEKYYSASFEGSHRLAASKDPADYQSYIGSKEASEAETLNLQAFIVDNHLKYFTDIHACAQMIGWPWALEMNGDTPAQNWLNTTYDRKPPTSVGVGGRDGDGPAYNEFFPNTPPRRLRRRHEILAKSARDQILVNAGAGATAKAMSTYTAQQLPGIGYFSTGTSTDYAFSRQLLAMPPVPEIYALVMESGSRDVAVDGAFRPTVAQFPKIEREIHAALTDILNNAAMWG
jgi:Zinc carboxypeptidase